jgi:hypothetical protein
MPLIIRAIKIRQIKWMGHVTHKRLIRNRDNNPTGNPGGNI